MPELKVLPVVVQTLMFDRQKDLTEIVTHQHTRMVKSSPSFYLDVFTINFIG